MILPMFEISKSYFSKIYFSLTAEYNLKYNVIIDEIIYFQFCIKNINKYLYINKKV